MEAELGLSRVLLERKDEREREEEVVPLGTSLSTAGCTEDVEIFEPHFPHPSFRREFWKRLEINYLNANVWIS